MDDKKYCVYKHTSPSGKVYIGRTCLPLHWRSKYNGSGYKGNTSFYNAIQKYGWENFEHEIIKDNMDIDEANEFEIEMIKKYKSNQKEFGYNLQAGGENGSPVEETRKRMSEWQIGKKLSEETKQKISKAHIGQKDSDETRKKKSESHKGKTIPKEVVKKMNETYKKHLVNNKKPVICIETNECYESIAEAARKTNICGTLIGGCCNGKFKTAGGYHWKHLIA